MSNKQSLSLEKVHTLYFSILNILFTFSSQVLFCGLGYSVLTRSLLCLVDKSSQFCNTGNKYFGSNNMHLYEHNKRCTTCKANMHVRATLS